MKLKYEFVERLIVDEYVLVPVGEAARAFSGMIATSEVGAYILNALKTDTTPDAILAGLIREYEVDEATAAADLDAFLDQLRQMNLLEQ